MTLVDKTGAPVTVTKDADRYVVGVEGQAVGLAQFAERGGQRVFFHTEVDEAFGGRGLATVLIGEALAATRAEGKRIVAVCPMVVAYVGKNHEFDDITDPATPEILQSLQ